MFPVSASSLLLALDPEQQTAVTAPADAVIVVAGAGSGKTTVLTQRIIQRIDNASADAEHTLAITFTREAAGQLRRRTPKGVHTGTFHAVAFSLIRQRLTDQGKSVPTVLTNKFGIMNEALRGIRSRVQINEALAEVEWMQARALSPATYASAARDAKRSTTSSPDDIATVFVEYDKLKRKRGVVDLGDLLVRATDDIVSNRDHAEIVRWRYRHILVDEAQDMNPQQFAFFQALRGDRRDVFVVGAHRHVKSRGRALAVDPPAACAQRVGQCIRGNRFVMRSKADERRVGFRHDEKGSDGRNGVGEAESGGAGTTGEVGVSLATEVTCHRPRRGDRPAAFRAENARTAV